MTSMAKRKEAAGYEAKPFQKICGNCAYGVQGKKLQAWQVEDNERNDMFKTKNKRWDLERDGATVFNCSKHGFEVGKTGACPSWRKE